jgi:hypothetical protein
MSWDVLMLNPMNSAQTFDDLGDTNPLHPLCSSLADLHVRVLEVFPDTDWSDPAWGRVMTVHGSIEFNVGRETPITCIALHVRSASSIVPDIVRLGVLSGWSVFDGSTGERLDGNADPTRGIDGWNRYAAQVHKLK